MGLFGRRRSDAPSSDPAAPPIRRWLVDPATNPRVWPGETILDWGPAQQRLARIRMGVEVTPFRATVVKIALDGKVIARDENGREYVVEWWSRPEPSKDDPWLVRLLHGLRIIR